jgi:hypothetical protein
MAINTVCLLYKSGFRTSGKNAEKTYSDPQVEVRTDQRKIQK